MTHGSPGFVAAVDDDRRILDSLQTLLESADYAVRVFESGAALLDSGCVAHIDCLISDIRMPGMDGFELSRRVRAVRPGLPVILITGRADMLKPARAAAPSDNLVFEKPFDAEGLLAAVARELRAAQLQP